jgi:ABC-2 type transport system permease protein
LATVAAAFSCTALGLCLGALGLRGRNVSVFADVITGCMLIVSGANVPLHLLPGWVQKISSGIPLTHGIAAARAIANGASISAASDLLLKEFAIGGVYLVIGLAMLRFFEFEGRRTASLETF